MEAAFGARPPYTVGVEEEFQLVDPASRALVPAVGAVMGAGDGAGVRTSQLPRSRVAGVAWRTRAGGSARSAPGQAAARLRGRGVRSSRDGVVAPVGETVSELGGELPALR